MKSPGALFAVVLAFAASCTAGDDSTVVVSTPNAHVVLGPRTAQTSDALVVLRSFDAFRDRLTKTQSHAWSTPGSLHVRLPDEAHPALHLEVEGDASVSLDVTAEDDARVQGIAEQGTVTLASVRADTDVVHVADAEGAEEIRLLRTPSAPTVTRYRLEAGPGVSALRIRDARVQVLDSKGLVRIESAPMFAVDAKGTRRDLTIALADDSRTLTASLDTKDLVHPIAVDPAWNATGSMTQVRDEHRAVLLADGRVFTTGWYNSTAEIYDPAKGTWTATAPLSVTHGRAAIAALGSGKVLLAGGGTSVTTAQTYNPSTNTWTYGGTPPSPGRDGPSLTVLPSGRVVLIGGYEAAVKLTTAALYDPLTNGWTALPSMTVGRDDHKATLLTSGKVLVTCGNNTSALAELYDPVANKWTSAGTMSAMRDRCTSTLLPSGKVLVYSGGSGAMQVDVYDPTTNTWSSPASGVQLRLSAHTATLLASGKVLIAGGTTGAYIYTPVVELFDPATNKFSTIESMLTGRGDPIAVKLNDGRVLVSGGKIGKGVSSASSEIYGGALGAPCTSKDACGSGFCVDSVCCNAASCPAGSVCNTTAKPGICALTTATACTKPSDCSTGFCVDGVCCLSACTNQCEACDTDTDRGKCVPVSGPPHGARPKCDTGGTDPCAARACDGAKDATKCVGYVSGSTAVCKAPSCIGSTFIGPSTCDGAGGCATPKEIVCDPYACAETGCKSTCTADTDCLKGYTCKGGSCTATDAECINGGAQSKAKDGKVTDCTPYRCNASQECGKACATSGDCLAGFVCDTPSKTCIDPNAGTGSSGGCQTGHGDAQGGAAAILALALVLSTRRRRCA